MKKVQDHYFRRAKKEGYPARSVYKLEETQQKYKIINKGDIVLDLGCQPGSWSLYAAKVSGPQGLVIGVDMHKVGDLYRTGAAKIISIQADIMDENIMEQLKEQAISYNVVLSDIAPHTTGNKWTDQCQSITLASRCFEIAGNVLHEGGNFYCKIFQGEDANDFVKTVNKKFQTVKTVKPKSSRKESVEMFVLGMNYTGNR
ncbi:MAG: RlmE family RNA methyltransferase [Proteobacteria bacterium]|nr:RlmE family RNA methyltransferase [Pseudomonadota bacterium]MBU1710560.1 RlmE family RNA methyltransferase [Pseudomonadota bacterium]